MKAAVEQGDWRRGEDFTALIDGLLPAVAEAVDLQCRALREGVAVAHKSDATPVTEADRASERLLTAALTRLAPDVPIVAEEAVAASGQPPIVGDLFFLVDPLDGTREFIHGRSEFTINVALVRRGHPVFGLIAQAATGALYLTRSPSEAVRGRLTAGASGVAPGRWDGSWQRMRARAPDADGLDVLLSRSHPNAETEALIAGLPIARRRAVGSSLKFCMIAAGEADLHVRVGPTAEWDIAAGHAILSAAGGRLLAIDGSPLVYGKSQQGFRNEAFVALGRETAWPAGTAGEHASKSPE